MAHRLPRFYLETDAEITADNETGNLTIRTTTPYVDLTRKSGLSGYGYSGRGTYHRL